MYEFFFKSVTSNALGPLPCHKLSHLLGPPPLERDVLYGRSLRLFARLLLIWTSLAYHEQFWQADYKSYKSNVTELR